MTSRTMMLDCCTNEKLRSRGSGLRVAYAVTTFQGTLMQLMQPHVYVKSDHLRQKHVCVTASYTSRIGSFCLLRHICQGFACEIHNF